MDEASKEKAREKVRDNKELQHSVMNRKYVEFCSITIPSSPTNERKKTWMFTILLQFSFNPLLAHMHFYFI